MVVQKISYLGATMTKRTDQNSRNPAQSKTSGFTLVELLIASFIAGLVSTLTWNILIENTKSNVRAEFRRRLHEDWNQATTLIQSEIAMSHSIESTGLSPSNVTNDCPLLQDPDTRLKLRMHLIGTMPDILYGIRRIGTLPESESKQWMGGTNSGILIRCGPRLTISDDGRTDYIQGTPYQQSIVLDNIDLSNTDGFEISEATDSQKLVEFTLSMNETLGEGQSTTIRTQTLSSGGVSRINEVPPIPSDKTTCERICRTKDIDCGYGVTTLLSNMDRLYTTPIDPEPAFGTDTICTNRSLQTGDGINGANGNYVMDANPTPNRNNPKGIKINGGNEGRNILLGTSANDTLQGGPHHDALIGRGGDDSLSGEAGNDSLVPWSSTTQENSTVKVNGGMGFDRVYLKGEASNYTLRSCSINSCKIDSSSGGTLNLTSVEMLVFKSSNRRLTN